MDRVWDTSKYPFKPVLVLCQIKVIQGHVVKKSNEKFCVWVVWYMFLGHIFVKRAKNDNRTLFERPKSDKNWKSEKCLGK